MPGWWECKSEHIHQRDRPNRIGSQLPPSRIVFWKAACYSHSTPPNEKLQLHEVDGGVYVNIHSPATGISSLREIGFRRRPECDSDNARAGKQRKSNAEWSKWFQSEDSRKVYRGWKRTHLLCEKMSQNWYKASGKILKYMMSANDRFHSKDRCHYKRLRTGTRNHVNLTADYSQ